LQLPTRALPALVGLPDIHVLVLVWVIAQAALASCDGLLNRVVAAHIAAANQPGPRRARCEDVQAHVSAEAELHRYRATGLDRVQFAHVDGLEEPIEGKQDDDVERACALVSRLVRRRT